ncbi:asparagine synthase (glutamine-hydrolyzing) [Arenibacter sp. 6A1]|uniref:asparagine synthase (glutamine-hydrolyzing) n=1 Tax=Arenibacter sp. 6A1 TaxID=2720391 RepID=UPI001446B8C9|nr:asparagine synthase (glutamine-hydrolyzing) [Arenibacter sp. 6A1]NKI27108.1 asparagine synthase (glutamine-hydrolyzing) [Arenibacter sp. 6A1]
MCGINGFIIKTNQANQHLAQDVNDMNNLITHRGPDDDGVFTHHNDRFSIGMGMRRLSIIDLSLGKQPIFSEDKQLVIVFNGEIYNYLDLKNKLQQNGVQFLTNSDTEVILKLYEHEGVSSFKKLDGMFAFSIYDKKRNKLFIARDFFGEKPLYYTSHNDQFVWGSELKSVINKLKLKPEIDKKGLNLFFRLTYIPAPFTIYNGVYKLEANHYLSYDLLTHEFVIIPIEKPSKIVQNKNYSLKTAKKEVKELVYETVSSRSISDVPLGTFLSGGVDSSIVSLCLAQGKTSPIDTFSIGFEKKAYDETDKSRVVAKLIGSNHHEFVIGEKDIQKNIEEILLNFDEPFADSSSLPTYLVSNRTSDYVKVALTGDGGDEVFGGYNKYYMGKMNNYYSKFIPEPFHNFISTISSPILKTKSDKRKHLFKLERLLNSINYNGQYYWDIISLGYTKNSLHQFLLPAFLEDNIFEWYKNKTGIANPTSLSDFRTIDKHISLEGDMLVKVDRTSMLNSLECRAPFLNKTLWNYTNSLPESLLLKGWNKKYILKEAFKDQFDDGFLDKSKSGFGAPVGDWLRSSLKSELESYIDTNKLENQGIFNIDATRELIFNHLNAKADNTFKVWTFYCFQKWYYNTYQNL